MLAQEDVGVYLLIRDDGSSDGTSEIIREYVVNYDNVNACIGRNVGVVESFNTLIQDSLVDEFDYIAFCDQDDYWMPDKMKTAIDILGNAEEAQLYCSNLEVVDEELQFMHYYRDKMPKYTIYTSVVQNCATGCTQVFNKIAVDIYRKGINCRMEMHDYWMFLICMCFGRIYYDMNANILYRQHENNVVGDKEKTVRRAIKNIEICGKRETMIADFVNAYSVELSNEQKAVLKPIVRYRRSITDKIKLICCPYYHGYNMKVTLGFKLRTLVGRIY